MCAVVVAFATAEYVCGLFGSISFEKGINQVLTVYSV